MKKLTCFVFSIVLLYAIGCSSKAKNDSAANDGYEKAKETLEEKEKKNPVAFLKVSSRDKHNLIGQTVIKGTISNNAKVCMFKDVELELSFFSKTGVLLEKDHKTIYDSIGPGKSVEFKEKLFVSKDADSIGIKVLGAKTN